MKIEDKTKAELADKILELHRRIEQLEQSEKAAQERSEFFLEILDSLPGVITAWDSAGIQLFVNQSFVSQSGFRREDVIGKASTELYPPEEIVRLSAMYEELRDKPDGASFTSSVHGRTASGEWVEIEGTVIKKIKPPICGYVGYAGNVTQPMATDVDFKESAAALDTVINSVPEALLIHDRSGKVFHFNEKMVEMSGINLAHEVLNPSPAGSFYSPVYDSVELCSMWEDVASGAVKQLEYKIKRPTDGKIIDAEIFMRSIRLKGDDHILVSIKDVTEKKRLDDELHRALSLASMLRTQAEAASAAKSEFLTNMSHELRTPLNAILGFSELLEEQWCGKLNEKQLEYAREIYGAGRHLLRLINDILDLAKVESGKMDLRISITDFNDLMRGCLSIIRETAIKRGLALELEIADDLFQRNNIRADDVRLKQIIMNLLSNAAKFTPSGGVIHLDARKQEDEILISVSDTGIGIKPQDKERIFQEFEQVDSSFSRQEEGTGLGLSLTRRLVELHGGRIWVESEGENKGSVFSFTIPFVDAGKQESIPLATTDDGLHPRLRWMLSSEADRRPTVMVVEDNTANMKLATNLLEAGGYNVLQAFSAEEAVKRAEPEEPSLILMDISLPGMDGLTATKILKDNPATAHIPIVALTAHAMKDDEARAKEVGCDGYILKPIDTRIFYSALSKLIRSEDFGVVA
jgi:PAS domain S-box-containing protein